MDKPVEWPTKLLKSNWSRKIIAALHGMAFFALLTEIAIHIILRSFGDADGVRIMTMVWTATSYINFLRACRLEDGLDQVVVAAKQTVDLLQIENQALNNSYMNVVETMDKIDKRILAKHGIVISLTKPEKLKN